MVNKEIKLLVEYWQKSAKRDYETMLGLFKLKRYPESLFFGHIALEKILKALVVKKTGKEAPKIHDLVKLAELASLDLEKEEVVLLKIINRFNMRARYPDVKLRFYQRCDYNYANRHLRNIKDLYKKLWERIK